MILDELRSPVVLAPMAGGPSTPELAAAVSQTGGLGFLASGYHSATELNERLATMRRLDAAPFGVNVFVPELGPADPTTYASYVERLEVWARRAGVTLGEPTFSDDDWRAKLELLTRQPVAVVSFTFGCPSAEVMGEIRATGSEAWVTITNPDEARQAAQAGADALIVQGAEAGGHRGSFADHLELPIYGLLPLLQVVRASVSLPLVAAGGLPRRRPLPRFSAPEPAPHRSVQRSCSHRKRAQVRLTGRLCARANARCSPGRSRADSPAGSYTQKLWMWVRRKAAYLPG